MRQVEPNPHFGVGVVGIGFGQEILIPAFQKHPQCKVVAVAASQLERAEKCASRFGISNAFADWRAVVECSAVDIVAIAVPPTTQPAIILHAAKNQKAVFAEKPVAGSSSGAKALEHLSHELPILIDFMFPRIATWKKAKLLIREGLIGELQHINLSWHLETYAEKHHLNTWKSQFDHGGGALNSFGSHLFYNLEFFAGTIQKISALLHADANRAEHAFDCLVKFESGATANVSVSTRMPAGLGHRIELCGNRGTLTLENGPEDYVSGFLLSRRTKTGTEVIQQEATNSKDGRIQPVFENICALVDTLSGKPSVYPTLKDALHIEKLLELAHGETNRHTDPGLQRGRKHSLSA